MKQFTISPLLPSGGELTGYLHDPDDEFIFRGKRPAILIFPGGGYQRLAGREMDPVAFEFYAAGFNTFFLKYSIHGEDHPEPLGIEPLSQASEAILRIRANGDAWNTRESQVAVLGFSAGGHLAGSCAVLWDLPELKELIDTKGGKNRPDAAILGYSVTVTGEYAHTDSIRNLVGNLGDANEELFNLPGHVTPDTPPCFLWSTVEDELVPVENTLLFANALQKHHISYELHLYTHGRHGLTLGMMETNESHPHLASWVRLCKEWLGDLFEFPVSVS
ncbi:MAG: alpha/beta hydrolase [Lachnospiraceae bacterium]|nr:alpha/beta hydrolase [Lachnospiraceae bacterium]